MTQANNGLPNAKQTLTRANLISEGLADLRAREWHFAVVEVEQTGKVDEVTLCSLWAKVAGEPGFQFTIFV